MKVGTDGILLGARAPIAQVKHVLDIGTGSGLLALMLAQRTADSVQLDAVELDEEAATQARDNVAASNWPRTHRRIPGADSAVAAAAAAAL